MLDGRCDEGMDEGGLLRLEDGRSSDSLDDSQSNENGAAASVTAKAQGRRGTRVFDCPRRAGWTVF